MSDNPNMSDTKTQVTDMDDRVSNDVCFALVEWPENGLMEYNPPLGMVNEFFNEWFKAEGAEAVANPNFVENLDDQWVTIPPGLLKKYRVKSTCYGVGNIVAMHIHLLHFVDVVYPLIADKPKKL